MNRYFRKWGIYLCCGICLAAVSAACTQGTLRKEDNGKNIVEDSIAWLSAEQKNIADDNNYMLLHEKIVPVIGAVQKNRMIDDSGYLNRSYLINRRRQDDYWKNAGIILLMK